MKPFIIVHSYNILCWDKPSVLVPKNQDEALNIQQRLEYAQGIPSQIMVREKVRSLVRT